jgi:hypothetical protein
LTNWSALQANIIKPMRMARIACNIRMKVLWIAVGELTFSSACSQGRYVHGFHSRYTQYPDGASRMVLDSMCYMSQSTSSRINQRSPDCRSRTCSFAARL